MLRAFLDEKFEPGKRDSRKPRVRAEGIEVVGHGAIVCHLCRNLIAAGHDPSEPMEVYRSSEMVALKVRSIGEAAKLTVKDQATRFAKYDAPVHLR
jgi:hypothetical protein